MYLSLADFCTSSYTRGYLSDRRMFASLVSHQHLPGTEIDDLYKQLRPYQPAGSPRRAMAPTASEKLKDLDDEFERTMLRFEARMPQLAAVRAVPDARPEQPVVRGADASPLRLTYVASPFESSLHRDRGAGHDDGAVASRLAAAVRREVFGGDYSPEIGGSNSRRYSPPNPAGGFDYRRSQEQASSAASLRGRISSGYATVEDGRNAAVVADEVAGRLTESSASPRQQVNRPQYPQYASPVSTVPVSEAGSVPASPVASPSGALEAGVDELRLINQLLRGEREKLLRQVETLKVDSFRREQDLVAQLDAANKELRRRDDIAAYGSAAASSSSLLGDPCGAAPCERCAKLGDEINELRISLEAERENQNLMLQVAEDIAAVAIELLRSTVSYYEERTA